MKCIKCGYENIEVNAFCSQCGSKLESVVSETPTAPIMAQPIMNQVQSTPVQNAEPQMQTQLTPEQESKIKELEEVDKALTHTHTKDHKTAAFVIAMLPVILLLLLTNQQGGFNLDTPMLISMVTIFLSLFVTLRFYEKLTGKFWQQFVPIYGQYVIVKELFPENPILYFILNFVPIANFVVALMTLGRMSRKFGINVVIFFLFGPFVMMYIALSNKY